MSNRLKNETSPYLLQHAENPVDWYPWSKEAFEKAYREDKPVFLSIGYSACHWCHVMAHECFEDAETAELLNRYFVSVKVDREERPDIDSVYMASCQAMTGSGGWPMSIFMTPAGKPFFAGTYFPKTSSQGMPGFMQLLETAGEMWNTDKEKLLRSADEIAAALDREPRHAGRGVDKGIIDEAVSQYKSGFDAEYGGFWRAPKFPAPHNLLFLMNYFEKTGDTEALEMAETTLMQMYRGGIFDHIGGGFCRYSTDRYYLVPHFEKMLYDNALLITAYCRAYSITGRQFYLTVAERTAGYVLREMTGLKGGFYSTQDADSEGAEGKYYLFDKKEIVKLLGMKRGEEFCRRFDISEEGNFEGMSIPNLLKSDPGDGRADEDADTVYEYRKGRYGLHLDDKVLTVWNALMISAMSALYRVSGKQEYIDAAVNAWKFIEEKLCDEDRLYVSIRDGRRGESGFLDDYACCAFAMLSLYDATLDNKYLTSARHFCSKAVSDFEDSENGGFFMSGTHGERLIMRPKETYDGAIPSGNSVMAYVLVRLYLLTGDESIRDIAERQLDFMSAAAEQYPAGHAMFLMALSDYLDPPDKIVVVPAEQTDKKMLANTLPQDAAVIVLDSPTDEYRLKNGKTTYYVCRGHACLPPVNDMSELL